MSARGTMASQNTVLRESPHQARSSRSARAATVKERQRQALEAMEQRLSNVEAWIHACGEGKIALPPDGGHESRLAVIESRVAAAAAAGSE